MTKTIIKYRPFPNTTLTYTIKAYEVVDGVFVRFYDEKDRTIYSYPLVKCEILEMER